MFDNLFNYIIILIPVAIFIFRIVNNYRKPENPAARSGEEGFPKYDGDDVVSPPRPVVERVSLPVAPKPEPFPAAAVPAAAPQKTRVFPKNLDYLPPLKRAVALSEILGPPKGL